MSEDLRQLTRLSATILFRSRISFPCKKFPRPTKSSASLSGHAAALPPAHCKSNAALFGRSQHPPQDAVTRTTKSCARTPHCRLHTADPMPCRSGALSTLAGCRHTDNKIMHPHTAALPSAHRKSDAALFGRSQHPRRMPSHGQQNLAPARRPASTHTEPIGKPQTNPTPSAVRYRRTCAQPLRVVDRHREMFAEKFLAFS